ncbi:MAG: NPXTG-anchored protein [Oscillospiraceae bacterium]
MKIRNIISAAAACAVAAAALVMPTSAEDSYVAGITWQSSSYFFRNNIAQSELLYWDNDLGEAAPLEGATYVDATITGDGTYTVELNGVKDGGWNMLKLETNIDLDATPDIKLEITDVELNGASVDFDKEAASMSENAGTASDDYSDWDFSISNTGRIQLINVYDNLAAIPNDTYESVKVTFTVSGMSAADTGAADATDATDVAVDNTASADKGSPDTGVEGVAVVAGLAVVAAGALVVSRKRK